MDSAPLPIKWAANSFRLKPSGRRNRDERALLILCERTIMSEQTASKLRAARTEIRGLRNRMELLERDTGALADAVGRYLDGGGNDEDGLRAALSTWTQESSEDTSRG